LVWRVDYIEVAGHLRPTDGEDQNLHRHVEVNRERFRHRANRPFYRSEVPAFAAQLEVHVVVGRPGIEPTRSGFVGEGDTIPALADVLIDVSRVVRHRRLENLRRQLDCNLERGRPIAVRRGAEGVDAEQPAECGGGAGEAGRVIRSDGGGGFSFAAGERPGDD